MQWELGGLAVPLPSSSLQEWLGLWSFMLGWLFFLLTLQNANNRFNLKASWPHTSSEPSCMQPRVLFFSSFLAQSFQNIFTFYLSGMTQTMCQYLCLHSKKTSKTILPQVICFASVVRHGGWQDFNLGKTFLNFLWCLTEWKEKLLTYSICSKTIFLFVCLFNLCFYVYVCCMHVYYV